MLFASGGFRVKLYDIEQQQVTNALENIRYVSWHLLGGLDTALLLSGGLGYHVLKASNTCDFILPFGGRSSALELVKRPAVAET